MTATLPIRAGVPGAVTASKERLGTRSAIVVRVDSSQKAGALSPNDGDTIAAAAETALAEQLPLVTYLSSSGADIAEGVAALHGWGLAARAMVRCSGVVPNIIAVTGPAVSGPALLLGLADIVIMTTEAYAFVSGPHMVREFTGVPISNDRLGGAGAHARTSGVASFVAADETAAAALVEDLLSYLPPCLDDEPPRYPCFDPADRSTPEAGALIPASPTGSYVLGASFFDFIELDEELTESIGYALEHPGLLLPTLYKVRHKDGHFVTCEVVANNALLDPMIEGLVVTFRTFDERLLLDQMLESVGLGAPVTETLDLAVRVIGEETLAAKGAVAYHPTASGFESCLATPGLPEIMRGGPSEVPGAVEGSLPWIRALHTRQEQFATLQELPAAVGTLCRTEGVVGCWALPIITDGRAVACMIVWRTKDEPPEPAHRLAADRLVRHIGVALERDQHTLQLQHAALHDSLTSLPNRLQFFDRLDREMARAEVDDSTLAVFYVDLDGFKRVNDLLGHAAGDEVLVEAARRIENAVRPGDLSARLGGDEFAVICPDIGDVDVAHQIAERLVHEVAKPISLSSDGTPVHIGASVGVAIAQQADLPATVLEAADAALYEAKNAGKGRWITATR